MSKIIDKGVRINKYLAEVGISTRRGADTLIEKGLININGTKAKLGSIVYKGDKVTVDKAFNQKSYSYYAYYKPRGISTDKQKGSDSIVEYKKFKKGVFPLGRLDKESEGLIIMTDDGRITDRMLNPKYEHEKEYVIKLDTPIKDEALDAFDHGIKLEDGMTKPAETSRINGNTFAIIIKEGKNRQIRRMCQAFDLHVRDLKRVRVMNIELGKLKINEFRIIEGKELEKFLKLLKL